MNHKQNINFQVEDTLFELESETTKININNKTYNCWFLVDLYSTFKHKKPGFNITLLEFTTSLQENKKYVIVKQNHYNQHIVFSKDNYDHNVADEIAKSGGRDHNKITTSNEIQKSSIIRDRYEDISDDDSENFEKVKVIKSNMHKNKFKGCKREYKEYEYKKYKANDIITSNKKMLNTYDDYRTHMLEALEYASAFPVQTFSQAMISKHGQCFDYKKAKCNSGKHTRGKLSTYLDDCSDILKRINITNVTYYQRKDSKAQFLIDKRKNSHLKKYIEDKANNKYNLEIMIVNIFPVRTTASITEIEKIFELVYGVPLIHLIDQNNFKTFLYNCKSPNMILKDAKHDAKVTLIPTHTKEYVVYGNIKAHESALTQENLIINKLTTANVPEPHETKKIMTPKDMDMVKSSVVFSCTSPDIANLLQKADLNIPVMLQEPDNTLNLKLLNERCKGSNYGFKPEFFHLVQNINFGDEDSYFIYE